MADPPVPSEWPVAAAVEAPARPATFLGVPSDARMSLAPVPDGGLGAGGVALSLAWAASAALIVAVLAAAYAFRVPIEQAWPPSTRLFAALGLG